MAGSTDPRRRLLAGIAAAVAAVLWLQFFLIPQAAKTGRLSSELRILRTQVQKTRRELKQLPEMEKNRALLAAQYSVPAAAAPPEEQLPDLLEQIAQAARSAHVRIIVLRPKQDLAQARAGASGYLEIPLELAATAGYHQVGRFLDELERSGTLVRLRELEIRPSGQDLWNHQVKMQLLAFLVPNAQ